MRELDYEMVKYLISKKIYFIVILNKTDKLKKDELQKMLEKTKKDLSFLKNIEIFLFSSKTGKETEILRERIENYKKIYRS